MVLLPLHFTLLSILPTQVCWHCHTLATATQPFLPHITKSIPTFIQDSNICVCPDYKSADPLRHCSLKAFNYLKMHLHIVCFLCKCLRLNNKIANTQKPLSGLPSIQHATVARFNGFLKCGCHFIKGLDVKNLTERQDTVLSTHLSCCATHWIHSVKRSRDV